MSKSTQEIINEIQGPYCAGVECYVKGIELQELSGLQILQLDEKYKVYSLASNISYEQGFRAAKHHFAAKKGRATEWNKGIKQGENS